MVTNLHNSFLPGDWLFTLLNLQSHKIRNHSLLHNFNNDYTLCPQSQHSVIAHHNSNLGEYVFKYSFLYLQFQEILCPLLAGTSCGASMYNQVYTHTHMHVNKNKNIKSLKSTMTTKNGLIHTLGTHNSTEKQDYRVNGRRNQSRPAHSMPCFSSLSVYVCQSCPLTLWPCRSSRLFLHTSPEKECNSSSAAKSQQQPRHVSGIRQGHLTG